MLCVCRRYTQLIGFPREGTTKMGAVISIFVIPFMLGALVDFLVMYAFANATDAQVRACDPMLRLR